MTDLFDEVVNTEDDDNVANIGANRNVTIETPLFDISFKQFEIGEKVVDGNRGLVPASLFSSICDKMVIILAGNAANIHASLVSDEDVSDNKIPKLSTFFDRQTATLKDEFKTGKTDSQINTAERLYSEIVALNGVLVNMEEKYNEMFPVGAGIQYAYVSNDKAESTGYSVGQLLNLTDAIQFRIATSKPRIRQIARAERRRNGGKVVDALNYADVGGGI